MSLLLGLFKNKPRKPPMPPKNPIHPLTPANAEAWIGTDYVLIQQKFGRVPKKDEIVRLVNLSASGADQDALRAEMATWPPDPPPPLPDPSPSLTQLTSIDSSRHRFIDSSGSRVFLRGASEFLLYKKYLDGEDITPQLTQLKDLGANMIRVMGMFESLGGFNPKVYGNRYYDSIPDFIREVGGFGLYTLWCACAATSSIFTDNEAIDHIKRTISRLREVPDYVLFSPVNEQGQHNNSINRSRLGEVDYGGILHDTGSFGMDLACEAPLGDWCALHTNRHYPNSVKDGCSLDHPNKVNDNKEILMEEPDRYGDEGNPSIEQARDAAGSSYASLGWVFHSMQGERGEVLRGNTLDCAQEAFSAMKGH